MSRKRKKGQNRGQNSQGQKGQGQKGQGQKGQGQKGQGQKGQGQKQKRPPFDPAAFWGDPEALPAPHGYNLEAEDNTAVLRSLGRPPIPGSETAAEHHFAMVYDNAVNLAMALATAGGLYQMGEDTPA